VRRRKRFTIAELFAITARAYERVAHLRGVSLAVTATDVTLEADEEMFRRVFENLIENALRYVNQGGHIVLHAATEDDRVLLAVANTGPPVPVKNRRVIFEKFGHVQRHSGVARLDLGLGLYFCRLVASAHQGTISVEDVDGWTTSFVIHLPDQRNQT